MLSSGPGPGPLLAAAAAWASLSAEYASAGEELGALLASVHAGTWQGPSSEAYVTAHAPYLEWLTSAAVASAARAAQHEAVASAYTAALAGMPTLPELAANHAAHAILTATNFFGINTIPIALNEADYVRMWVQAATIMSAYEALSRGALTASPDDAAVPQIFNSAASTAASSDPPYESRQGPQQLVQSVLRLIGMDWDPTAGTLNGIPYASYTSPLQQGFWISRLLLFGDDAGSLQDWIQLLLTNPISVLQSLAGITPAQLTAYLTVHPALAVVIASSPLGSTLPTLPAAAASVAAVAGMATLPSAEAVGPVPAPVVGAATAVPASTIGVAQVGSVPPSASAPAPVTTVSTVSSPPPSAAPSVPAGHTFVPYAVGGGPGVGSGPVHRGTGGASSRAKTPEPDGVAAAAATAGRRKARNRRRQYKQQHGYADEYVYMTTDFDEGPQASDRSAGPLGCTATSTRQPVRPAGLTTLAGDPYGGGPSLPLLPSAGDTGS